MILYCLKRIYEFPVWKLLAGIFLWILTLCFGPFRAAYSAIGIAVVTDFATGYYYARADPNLLPDSRRLYHGLVKIGIYLVLLILAYQCSKVELAYGVQALIEAGIFFTEFISIGENLQKIAKLKGKTWPIVDLVMNVLRGKMQQLGNGGPNHG